LIGLAAAAAALIRAKALVPQAAGLEVKLGSKLDYAGLGFVAFGLLWLLIGLIYRDLLPAVALTGAGLFTSLDFLRTRDLLKEKASHLIHSRGMLLGFAAGGLAVVHLFLGHLPLL
jgi:hypothetical protein